MAAARAAQLLLLLLAGVLSAGASPQPASEASAPADSSEWARIKWGQLGPQLLEHVRVLGAPIDPGCATAADSAHRRNCVVQVRRAHQAALAAVTSHAVQANQSAQPAGALDREQRQAATAAHQETLLMLIKALAQLAEVQLEQRQHRSEEQEEHRELSAQLAGMRQLLERVLLAGSLPSDSTGSADAVGACDAPAAAAAATGAVEVSEPVCTSHAAVEAAAAQVPVVSAACSAASGTAGIDTDCGQAEGTAAAAPAGSERSTGLPQCEAVPAFDPAAQPLPPADEEQGAPTATAAASVGGDTGAALEQASMEASVAVSVAGWLRRATHLMYRAAMGLATAYGLCSLTGCLEFCVKFHSAYEWLNNPVRCLMDVHSKLMREPEFHKTKFTLPVLALLVWYDKWLLLLGSIITAGAYCFVFIGGVFA